MVFVYLLNLGTLFFLIPLVVATQGGEVRCSETSVNVTRENVEQYGRCVPYQRGMRPTPCDVLFTPGVDYVYIPYRRADGSISTLNDIIADTNIIVDLIEEPCKEAARKAVCYFYYPPCGNSTAFQSPKSLCQDECSYVQNTICPVEWALAQDYFRNIPFLLNRYDLHFINCSNPAVYIEPLPHCCSDAMIQIPDSTSIMIVPTSTISPTPTGTSVWTDRTSTTTPQSPSHPVQNSTNSQIPVGMDQTSTTTLSSSSHPVQQPTNSILIISSSVSAAVMFLILVAAVVIFGLCITASLAKKGQGSKNLLQTTTLMYTKSIRKSPVSPRYFSSDNLLTGANHLNSARMRMAKVTSGYLRQMSEAKLLIPVRHIYLKDCIGQGEFGVVYRAHLIGREDTTTPKIVAVKTLKPMFSMKQVHDIMAESLKMKAFSHPNVLSLIGVCTDAGESPYIVMPYMAKGSLLAYLKKERPNLTIAEGASEDLVVAAQKTLLSMCLQIVKGMEYLAGQKFVHRDLAARNCMIDTNFVIKVADFGLSEDIYARNYFRQAHVKEEGEEVKLPARWMAIESLIDGMFSEKSDVWSYGVTCWEVFSLGRTPYPGTDPFTLVKFLQSGGRLERPANAACSQEYYEVILGCWKECATERPSFSELVTKISCLLEDIAGYIVFSVTPKGLDEAFTTQSYDHLTEVGKDHSDNSDIVIDKDLSHENSEIAEGGGDNQNHQESQD